MTIEAFNSQLLSSIEAHYKGPFHQKLADALRTGALNQDLGKACAEMFRTSIEDIVPPEIQVVHNYGQGDIGSDYLVNLFIDDRIGRIIDILRKTAPGQKPDIDRIETVLSELSFMDRIEKSNPLFLRKQITIALSNIVSRQFLMHPYIPIENVEDLSFLGVCSLLNVFVKKQIKGVLPLPENLFRFLPTTTAKKPWLTNQRYFPIEQVLHDESFSNDPLFSVFADYNNRYIAEYKPDLPMSLTGLLSSSSFIWDRQIFGLDPTQIQAMTEQQRLELLMKNKNGIIERCFEYLSQDFVKAKTWNRIRAPHAGEMARDEISQAKMSALRVGNQIEASLREIESMRSILNHTVRAKKGARNSIREISDHFGDQTDTQFEAEVLSLLEKNPIEEAPSVTGLERVVFDLAIKYRRQVLLEASYREKITEETERLRILKKELGEIYSSIGDQYLTLLIGNQNSISKLLQAHTVFSYFVFNKDVFPQRVSFSQLSKKGAAQKILQFMGRRRPRERTQQGGLEGTIQEFLNTRSNQIFEQFKRYQSAGIRALSPEEVQSIVAITKQIQANPQDLQLFEKLEKILGEILVEDESFVKNCEDLSRDLSQDKVTKLQTHMNACLLFTEGQSASDATGIKRSLGFKKLHRAILTAMAGESIELRALKSGERILDQLESFNYPPEVLRSFEENIRTAFRTFSPETIRDIEMKLAPLNTEDFPQIKQKRLLLEEIKKKIFDLAPRGEGDFLSQRHMPPRNWTEDSTITAGRSIQNLFKGERGTYTKKFLEDHFRNTTFSYGELVKSLQAFVSRERINTNLFSPGMIRKTLGYLFQNEIDLAVLIGIHEQIREDYNAQLANLERLHVTQLVRKQSPGPSNERASVFDNTTLFRFYKERNETLSKNQKTSQQLYEQFLPLFLTSYLADAANLTYGSSFFVQRKLDALREILPGVDRVYGELDAFLISKGRDLAKLDEFFKKMKNQSGFLEEGFLEQLKGHVNAIVDGPIGLIGESALTTAIIGIGILSYTGSPILAVIGGMAITAFWMTQGKPFVKDVFATTQEAIRNIFGIGYSPSSINDYILDLFKIALKTEVTLSQSDRNGQLELQHLFSNALFLQEEFSIMRNSRYSLLEFKNRLHMLLPNSLENANFSTMILNLFFKFNEPLFLSTPSKLMKNAQNPLFHQAVKEYLLSYDQKIDEAKQKFLQDGHHEEECDLTLGSHSPFKDYLIQRARDGDLALNFPRNSIVHQFLGAQEFTLENMLFMPLEETQIVPTGISPNNLRAFLSTLNAGLALEDQFLGAIRPVLLRSNGIMTPSSQHLEAFDQGLKTSYFLLRYALDTARRLQNLASSEVLSSPADSWLSSTNETGQSIFLSPLFRESFSLLMRTAEFAASSGVPEGQLAFRSLVYIQGVVDSYLKRGNLSVIPMERLQELENAIVGLINSGMDNPQIIFPVIIERERNQNIELPFTVWSFGQKALSEEMGREEASLALRDENSSNLVYLSNQSIELFFTSDRSRGFALSPMVMNILEEALQHQNAQGILQFLGIMNERDQARLSSMQQPERFQPNIDQIRQSVSRNMARRQGQPLSLMPPQSQGAGSPLQQTEQQMAPAENPQEQMIQGAPEQLAAPQQQVSPGGMPNMAQGVNQQQMQQEATMGQEEQRNPSAPGSVPQRQDQEGSQGMAYMPMMMPGQGQVGAPQQEVQGEEAVQQQPATEAENRNVVMVGANGRSGTFSAGGQGGSEGAYQRLADRGERYAQMPARDVPPIGPNPERPYRGPMNMEDFGNYQEGVNQPQGFPYGKAAAIGGGLMLGAALLSQMMKKDDKKRKRP